MQEVALFSLAFVHVVSLSINHQEHCLIFSGLVKAGETLGIRISGLKG